MQGNFTFQNPTRLHFGKESLAKLSEELQNYGPKVMLTYGGGSIKRNGIYDIMSHILEQYLSDSDDNTSDYIAEGLMRSLIVSSRKALQTPQDYEARSNIMWTATWALNGLTACGKSTDWMVHMLGQRRRLRHPHPSGCWLQISDASGIM